MTNCDICLLYTSCQAHACCHTRRCSRSRILPGSAPPGRSSTVHLLPPLPSPVSGSGGIHRSAPSGCTICVVCTRICCAASRCFDLLRRDPEEQSACRIGFQYQFTSLRLQGLLAQKLQSGYAALLILIQITDQMTGALAASWRCQYSGCRYVPPSAGKHSGLDERG